MSTTFFYLLYKVTTCKKIEILFVSLYSLYNNLNGGNH